MYRFFWILLVCWCGPGALFAQNGDKAGEEQRAPNVPGRIPEAPPLPIEEALKAFRIQGDFRVEVVASEPMVEAPVEIEFDPDGRLFVLEMRGFMRTVDGADEAEPLGRVSLLTDQDGDGRMDATSVFADALVMPRAIAVVRGGLLVAEPPHLWFFQDADGDGKAEKKEEVSSDYGNQSNPEHNANGLIWGRDNWIYSANHAIRYRNIRGYWEKEPTQFRGQWGISQDDYGRLFFNSNSDQLRGDFVPGQYILRNPNLKAPYGVNVQVAKDQATFPIRMNPGVNRGYQSGTLRPDGTLAQFTGACGPCVYRGDLFPASYYGAAFLCEPTANLVRCNFLVERDGVITATNAFPQSEFLASTDERFRPVNIVNGPDGALYMVDIYRGVIQHKIYLTSYLRSQALSRGLESPVGYGRIYRIVPDRAASTKSTSSQGSKTRALSKMDSTDLVKELSSGNGWVRDTAQQLLVERADFQSFEALNELAAKGEFPSAIHALWVLNAVGELNSDSVAAALRSPEAKVRATAIRAGESYLRAEGTNELSEKILGLRGDTSPEVKLQLLLSLAESKSAQAEQALLELADQTTEKPLLRDAAVSGWRGRELAFLSRLTARPNWTTRTTGREALVRTLAECVAESRDAARIEQLLDLAARSETGWQQLAMLDGINGLVPKSRGKAAPAPVKPLRLSAEPPALAKFKALGSALGERLATLDQLLVWPGKPGFTEPVVKPLTTAENQRFEAGKAQYPFICGACHQPTGLGLEGLAPPLVDVDWATGPAERAVRIVLNGVRGRLDVKGKVWELEMPPLNVLSDEDISNLLTYIRREWGHTSSAVTPEFVGKIRADTAKRDSAWTEAELLKIQ